MCGGAIEGLMPSRTLAFPALCRALKLPAPVAEHRFHATRKWRFDWCWVDAKLALEVQGGIFTNGRHTRGAALIKEMEKLNAAAVAGYRVLYVTPAQMANGSAAQIAAEALGR